ncbi:MAG: Flp pilus assembly complex ATPase component TadA [Acholeplasmataceae bacterium]|nr:Flp pilus assembly complex ATPase component TadA [Acholeplasmataceae bacterium]
MALKRIGDVLLQAKVITQKQLNDALKKKEENERLGETIVRLEYANEMQILKALEDSTGVQRVSLLNFTIDENVLKLVDESFCRRNTMIPLRIEGNKLMFATSDPLDFAVVEELRLITGFRPKMYAAPKNEISTQIEKYYGFTRTLEALGVKQNVSIDIVTEEEDDYSDTPMVNLVNQILTSAVFQRASDIHIDPLDDKIVIRYRVDGVLDTVREFPLKILHQMISRIKVMSGMDITETRVPQDGRIQTSIKQRNIDLRISTLPTVRGEKVVMRILDISGGANKLDNIGLSKKEEKLVRDMIAKPNGIVLVSGPTGSGKTTTLYSCLAELNKPNVNIMTVENPVELKMEGVNQVQVETDVDLTFAKALRSILRQDPNIIMVGEIRDVETAEIAIRASLTGHLVLSTIHTNDAIKTVTRLLDMDIEPFLIASSLSGVVSQRLVRKLCSECSYDDEPSPTEIVMFKKQGLDVNTVRRAKGCPSCNYKGYAGRVGIFEVLPISDEMQKLISQNANLNLLEAEARKIGMTSILSAGLKKVQEGITSLEEVMKVAEE